ncbi:methyltransferase family protein [Ascidiimonas sp. W6]|uniref:methyltransferase family protein n=1 Tax=Ascidiimonas meishanensis TaxID=3128903 RepID=UPI0030ECCC85
MKLKKRDLALVALQVLFFVFYFLDFKVFKVEDLGIINTLGLVIAFSGFFVLSTALLQLNTNLSPFPTPKKGSKLIKNGLYSHIRHPIYTGILFTVFGIAIYLGSIYKIGIGFLLLLLFDVKVRYEEQLLRNKFHDYENYIKKTGRFLPR